jgi:uncharacterized protein
MKTMLLSVILFVSVQAAIAQSVPNVVLHLQSADTLVHKSVVNQIANIKKEFPQAHVELVCHGPGIDFLLKGKSKFINKINKMGFKDVAFVGCEFTMAQRNLKKEDLVPFATTVPFGLVEILKKQQDHWLYVKLGF